VVDPATFLVFAVWLIWVVWICGIPLDGMLWCVEFAFLMVVDTFEYVGRQIVRGIAWCILKIYHLLGLLR